MVLPGALLPDSYTHQAVQVLHRWWFFGDGAFVGHLKANLDPHVQCTLSVWSQEAKGYNCSVCHRIKASEDLRRRLFVSLQTSTIFQGHVRCSHE